MHYCRPALARSTAQSSTTTTTRCSCISKSGFRLIVTRLLLRIVCAPRMFRAGLRVVHVELLFAATVLALVGCGSAAKKATDSSPPTVRVGALLITIPVGFSRYEIHRHQQLMGIVVAD